MPTPVFTASYPAAFGPITKNFPTAEEAQNWLRSVGHTKDGVVKPGQEKTVYVATVPNALGGMITKTFDTEAEAKKWLIPSEFGTKPRKGEIKMRTVTTELPSATLEATGSTPVMANLQRHIASVPSLNESATLKFAKGKVSIFTTEDFLPAMRRLVESCGATIKEAPRAVFVVTPVTWDGVVHSSWGSVYERTSKFTDCGERIGPNAVYEMINGKDLVVSCPKCLHPSVIERNKRLTSKTSSLTGEVVKESLPTGHGKEVPDGSKAFKYQCYDCKTKYQTNREIPRCPKCKSSGSQDPLDESFGRPDDGDIYDRSLDVADDLGPTSGKSDRDADLVIMNGDGDYWSNEDGWGDLASATRFSTIERRTLKLPMGGSWTVDPGLVNESPITPPKSFGKDGLDAFTNAFIEALLFTETDDDDDSYPPDTQIDPHGLAELKRECAQFYNAHAKTWAGKRAHVSASGSSEDALAGHDFALTRNGHGAGFWDGDWDDSVEKILDDAAKAFGEVNLYRGDDEEVYVYGKEDPNATRTERTEAENDDDGLHYPDDSQVPGAGNRR